MRRFPARSAKVSSRLEHWNTDNSIGNLVYEKLMPGLKLTLDSSFQPNIGDKAGKFKTEYKNEKLIVYLKSLIVRQ